MGILVGLGSAVLAFVITGLAGAAVIFGVVFGGVIYAVVRYQALYAKPATSGDGGSTGDTSTWDSGSSSWMAQTTSDDAGTAGANCDDAGSDSGSCDSGGGDGGGGGD